MASRINPVRVVAVVVISLMLLGILALIASGQEPYVAASVKGYLHARFDLLRGKRELHVTVYQKGQRARSAYWVTRWGLPTSVKYYNCLKSSPCSAYHRSYDAQVRKAIKQEFGYDVLAAIEDANRSYISIQIHHE